MPTQIYVPSLAPSRMPAPRPPQVRFRQTRFRSPCDELGMSALLEEDVQVGGGGPFGGGGGATRTLNATARRRVGHVLYLCVCFHPNGESSPFL